MKENGGASTTPREPVKSTSASPGSHPRAPSRNPTRDVDQQHGSGSCHDDTPHQAGGVQPEKAEYESAEHRTDNPEQQIHQHAVAAAAHQFASKPAGDDADDNLPEEEHRAAESYCRNDVAPTQPVVGVPAWYLAPRSRCGSWRRCSNPVAAFRL